MNRKNNEKVNRENMTKENNFFIEDPAWEAEAIQFSIQVEEKIYWLDGRFCHPHPLKYTSEVF